MTNFRRGLTLKCLSLSVLFNFYTHALDVSNEKVDRTVSACMSKNSLTNSSIKRELESMYPKTDSQIEIYGVTIDQPRSGLVDILNKLLRPKWENAVVDFETVFEGRDYKSCKDTFCLADMAFGKGLGAYYLYFFGKYHLDLSPFSNEKLGDTDRFLSTARYTKNELVAVLKAVKLLPENSLKSLDYGYHAKKTDLYKGNTLANATINFFKLWSDTHEGDKIYTVIHELGHVIADIVYSDQTSYINYGVDNTEDWAKLSNWTWEKGSFLAIYSAEYPFYQNNFVSSYARANPVEDFAESFTTYILNPDELQAIAPEKYDFIKKYIFGDLEYNDLYCNSGSPNVMKELDFGLFNYREVVENCGKHFEKSLKNLNTEELNRCMYRFGFGKLTAPITISTSKMEEILAHRDTKKKAVKSLVKKYFAGFNSYSYCENSPSILIQNEEYSPDLNIFARDLCRWAKLHEKRNGINFSNEEAKEFMMNLVIKRMTP